MVHSSYKTISCLSRYSNSFVSMLMDHFKDVIIPVKPNQKILLYHSDGVSIKDDYWINFASITSTIANVMALNKWVLNFVDDSSTEFLQFLTTLLIISTIYPSKTMHYENTEDFSLVSCYKPVISDVPFRLLFLVYPWVSRSFIDNGRPGIEYPEVPFCGINECSEDQQDARNYWWIDFFFGLTVFLLNRFQGFSKSLMNQHVQASVESQSIDIDHLPKVTGNLINNWDIWRITNAVNAGLLSVFYFSYQICDIDQAKDNDESFFKNVGLRYILGAVYALGAPLMVHYTMFPKPGTQYLISEDDNDFMQKISNYHQIYADQTFQFELISHLPDLRPLLYISNIVLYLVTLSFDHSLFVTEEVTDNQLDYIMMYYLATQFLNGVLIHYDSIDYACSTTSTLSPDILDVNLS